jgi:hypothetical protein
MARRASSETAHLSVRLRESLRAGLEAEADRNGYSLNTEIVRRLEASLRDDDLGAILFGDREMFALMDTFARLIRAIEILNGKPFTQDPATYLHGVETIYRMLKNVPQLLATGKYPGGIRDIADVGALAAFSLAVEKDEARQAEKEEGAAVKEQPRRRGRPRRQTT